MSLQPAGLPVYLLSRPLRVGAYQRKAQLMAAGGRLRLTVGVPERWSDEGRAQPLELGSRQGYRLETLPILLPGSYHLHAYRGLGPALERSGAALLHMDEEPYNLATYLALRQARRLGLGSLFFSWQNLERRYPPPFAWLERQVYGLADGAIAGSEGAAAVLRAKGYDGPLWVLPQFGVDEHAFAPPVPDPRLAATRSAPLRLGYAGRLVKAKGLDLLLEAAAAEGGASVQLVGQGPEEASLRQLARTLGLGDRLRIDPWLPSTAMPDFYRAVDVLVLPSRSTARWKEQFGRVLIEAMAAGAVCVGADSGEIPSVIGSAGLTFPEGDATALVSQLRRLHDPALRRQLAEAGRRRVLEHFTMGRIADRTVAIYEELAGL